MISLSAVIRTLSYSTYRRCLPQFFAQSLYDATGTKRRRLTPAWGRLCPCGDVTTISTRRGRGEAGVFVRFRGWFLRETGEEVWEGVDGSGDVEEDGVGVEVHGQFDTAVAHGGHGGSGVGTGGGEVGAEGVAKGVDVGDAVAVVLFGDARGLEVGVEDADGRRAVEEFGVEFQVAVVVAAYAATAAVVGAVALVGQLAEAGGVVGEVFAEFFDDVGAEREHGFAGVFGVGGVEGDVGRWFGVEVELADREAGEFVVAE